MKLVGNSAESECCDLASLSTRSYVCDGFVRAPKIVLLIALLAALTIPLETRGQTGRSPVFVTRQSKTR
jgi:hypothetical protein